MGLKSVIPIVASGSILNNRTYVYYVGVFFPASKAVGLMQFQWKMGSEFATWLEDGIRKLETLFTRPACDIYSGCLLIQSRF